jgi:ABC-type proline/glycine betaine transport system permease subunit
LSNSNSRAAYDLFLWRHNGHHHDNWDSGAFGHWQEAMITLGLDDFHYILQIVLLVVYIGLFSLLFGGVITLLKPILSMIASLSFYIVLFSSLYSATMGGNKK